MARRKAPPKSQRRSRAGAAPKPRLSSGPKSRSKPTPRSTAKSRARDKARSQRVVRTSGRRVTKVSSNRGRSTSRPQTTRTTAKKALVIKPAKAPIPSRLPPRRLGRERRTLDEEKLVPTPPSSLDMKRRGSAVRSGRAEMAQNQAQHASFSQSIAAGDVDVDVENAYFSGDEAPGGDNPTPDQEVVEEIGKALGVEYQDAEELRSGDKIADRDKHRWELDPASSEDYKERKP